MSDRRTGSTNSLVDVVGLRVGHVQRVGEGWLTGSTVVLTGAAGAVGGVDVRGGGPGTRETDLLDPRNNVQRVHAVLLTGGSAFGLAAADGVMARLAAAGVGYPVGLEPGQVVPIVPAAVVFDLGRGGDFTARPDASFGGLAYDEAAGPGGDAAPVAGCVGAGTGAVAGGLKGGVGSASEVLPDGSTVGALVVVNAVGSTVDLGTGELLGARHLLPGEVPACGDRRLTTWRPRSTPLRHDPSRDRRSPRPWSCSAPIWPCRRPSARRSPAWATTGWPGRSTRCTRCSTGTRCSLWRRGCGKRRVPWRFTPCWGRLPTA